MYEELHLKLNLTLLSYGSGSPAAPTAFHCVRRAYRIVIWLIRVFKISTRLLRGWPGSPASPTYASRCLLVRIIIRITYTMYPLMTGHFPFQTFLWISRKILNKSSWNFRSVKNILNLVYFREVFFKKANRGPATNWRIKTMF